MDVKNLLTRHKILPDPLKDQFFLTDELIIQQIVNLADLSRKDSVLEIGTGIGSITKKLAEKAGKVITFEIDTKFKPVLSKLPGNVEIHYGNALKFVNLDGKVYNKIVANLPYSLCEPLLHNLTFFDYDKVILLVPKKFAHKIETNPVFGSFFKVKYEIEVNKNKFYPIPRTNSVVIDLVKLPDPLKSGNLNLYLRQYIYQREGQKVKNSLREGLIKFVAEVYKKRLTKNEARKIIKDSKIDENLIEKYPDNQEIYNCIKQIRLSYE